MNTPVMPRHNTGRVTAQNWHQHTACGPDDWDELTSTDYKVQKKAATEICGPCPVKNFCLQYALDTDSGGSVFGGLTERERRSIGHRDQRPFDVGEHVEELVAYRRRGLTWREMENRLHLGRNTLARLVGVWRRQVLAEGGAVPAELGARTSMSEEQVVELREQAARGGLYTELAETFGISPKSITRIVTGERYANFGGPVRQPGPRFAAPGLVTRVAFGGGQETFLKGFVPERRTAV